jgi:hypothetical protein
LIVATVVAVVTFFLGWALGRSCSSSGSVERQAGTVAADTAPVRNLFTSPGLVS